MFSVSDDADAIRTRYAYAIRGRAGESNFNSVMRCVNYDDQKRGRFWQVYDGTNAAGPSTLPTIHPGSINAGDFVRVTCNLVLVAKVLSAPKYALHLEGLTILALQPDDVASVL